MPSQNKKTSGTGRGKLKDLKAKKDPKGGLHVKPLNPQPLPP
jgi:hypothetical protein